jgi:hypothetical protein
MGFMPSDNADDLLGWQIFFEEAAGLIADLRGVRTSQASFDEIPLPAGRTDARTMARWRNYQRVSPVTTRKRKMGRNS